MTLRGGSLTADVNAMLTPENGYAVEHFLDAIERVLQSNTQIVVDDLELTVSITRSKNGGAYGKLRELAQNEVIAKNRMNPTDISNTLCFTICLAHFLDPHAHTNTLETSAMDMHTHMGFTEQQQIGFKDVSKFERALGIKIVVF